MKVQVKGLKVNYSVYGKGDPVILLHGWGSEISTMKNVIDIFSETNKVYAIDLPGFGLSEKPDKAWDLFDYEDLVTKFIEHFELDNIILVGHSFGGAISICLAYSRLVNIQALYLIDAAGIRRQVSLTSKLKMYGFKALKKFVCVLPITKRKKEKLINRVRIKIGSSDYLNATGVMRDTLVKVVNCDLQDLMDKILTSTSIIWGEDDFATPLESAQLMNVLIRNSKLKIIKNAGHFPFIENLEEFSDALRSEIRRVR